MQKFTENIGYLELIVGCMFARKTSRLIEIYNYCLENKIPIIAINHIFDTRYSENLLTSHDQEKIPSINIAKLNDIFENGEYKKKLEEAQVILINEGQFFEDLYEFSLSQVETHNKEVYICGLDGDFERKKFGHILDLIPIADTVIKLKANCTECSDKAIFTHRTSKSKEQVLVGTELEYKVLCRKCYIFLNIQK